MRAFSLAYREILQIASGELAPDAASEKVQTASGQFDGHDDMVAVAGRFPLPWSHYVRFLAVRNHEGSCRSRSCAPDRRRIDRSVNPMNRCLIIVDRFRSPQGRPASECRLSDDD